MSWTLKIFKRDQLRQTIRMGRRSYVIGRALTGDVVIPDNRVSRKHCALVYNAESDQYYVSDLGSTQGTYIDGRRVTEEMLVRVTSRLSFGRASDFSIAFSEESARPLERDVEAEDTGRVTSEFHLQRARSYADPTSLKKHLQSPIPRPDAAETFVAQHLYDLLAKMSLAMYPHQEFQILADQIFEITPADRFLLIRLEPTREPEDASGYVSTPKPGPSFQYAIDYSAFRPDAPTAALAMGDRFSRTMIMRSVTSNQAVLFAYEPPMSETAALLQASSSICAPLIGHDEVLGCFYLDVLDHDRGEFEETHLQFISMAAYFFALYLERERALESTRENERLSAAGLAVFGAAHHLKNILTALNGSRQILQTMIAAKQWESIGESWGVLCRSVDRMTNTIRDMLDFARDDVLQGQPTDVSRLLYHTYDEHRDRAKQANVELQLVQPLPAVKVECDREKIDEILRNLVINAVECFEAAPDLKRAQRLIELRCGIANEKMVVIDVADNGPGMPRDIQRRIFDLFYSTKGPKGTGLGLAISRKHARQHGGDLICRSTDAGTVFRLTLPLPES